MGAGEASQRRDEDSAGGGSMISICVSGHVLVHFRDPAAGCQLTWFDFGLNLPARLSDQSPQSSGQLVRVDSRSGQIVQRLAVANPGAFALAGGSLWVANFWTGQMRNRSSASR